MGVKEEFHKSETVNPRLRVVQSYLREVRALGFSETPDYEYLMGIVRGLNLAERDFVD
jgi:hypothetical protein